MGDEEKGGTAMGRLFEKDKKGINAIRRENKKRADLMEKKSHKHEVNVIFNKFYKNQVATLYREVFRSN
jgi:hypothetical protein